MNKLFRVDFYMSSDNYIYILAKDKEEVSKTLSSKKYIIEDYLNDDLEGFTIRDVSNVEEYNIVESEKIFRDNDWKNAVPFSLIKTQYTCQEILEDLKERQKILKFKEEQDKRQLKFNFYEPK